jgi:hypothetical protein
MAVDEAAAHTFDAEASSRMARLRRLQSGAHSGAWLTNLPIESDGCPTFSPSEWQALLRFRCGVPFQAHALCGGCGSPLDPFGDHALSCTACGLYARHNRLRNALAAEYSSSGQAVQLEVHLPGSNPRPADILLVEPDEPAPKAVDVSVVHPLHPSSVSAEDTPGTSAASREGDKQKSSAAGCRAVGWRFSAVCAETTGAWGPGAQRCVRSLIKLRSMRRGESVAEAASSVWRRLSSAVAKGSAAMLQRAFPEAFGGTCPFGGPSTLQCSRRSGASSPAQQHDREVSSILRQPSQGQP